MVVAVAAVVALTGSIAGYFAFGYSKKYDEIKAYDTGKSALRVGILSDSQLPSGGSSDSTQIKALKSSLENMKKQEVEVLILAGDLTDLGTKEAWQSFKDTYDAVYTAEKPIPVFAMGNHDYWLDYFTKSHEIATPAKMQKRFTEYTGEYPYSHKIINGYHFIVWSSSNGSYDSSYSNKKWITEQLDAAVKADPEKPIFVVTHLNPQDTVYGSDDWGNTDIYDVLKDYPQVISLSGHSHYALSDERSIWQREFTAVNTQTTDYIELESGKYNGTIPVNAYGESAALNPRGIIMTVEKDSVTLQRIDSVSGENIKEPWIIRAPFGNRSKFIYTTELREKHNTAPFFVNGVDAKISDGTDKDGKGIRIFSFNAAGDDDFVHAYKLEFLGENGEALTFDETKYDGTAKENGEKINQILYFSDFTNGLDKMSERAELRLPPNIPAETVSIRITAIDSFKRESAPVTSELSNH